MICIGTSGYAYVDWVGPYYPEQLRQKDWLAYYSLEFKAVEINFTYYRMPSARTFAGMVNRVPADFLFSVKATQEMTHLRAADRDVFQKFAEALKPLTESRKLGAVLAQFPYSFRNTHENVAYLKEFRERLSDLPIVVEFRNVEWLTEETFAFLREQGFGFCCVDEPRLKGLLPPIAEATSNVAYVRFHGRNAEKWWRHAHAFERYDYTYKKEELEEWLPKIEKLRRLAEITFLFANNHVRGQGIDTARALRSMLGA